MLVAAPKRFEKSKERKNQVSKERAFQLRRKGISFDENNHYALAHLQATQAQFTMLELAEEK